MVKLLTCDLSVTDVDGREKAKRGGWRNDDHPPKRVGLRHPLTCLDIPLLCEIDFANQSHDLESTTLKGNYKSVSPRHDSHSTKWSGKTNKCRMRSAIGLSEDEAWPQIICQDSRGPILDINLSPQSISLDCSSKVQSSIAQWGSRPIPRRARWP